jgi:protein-arginine kinase activator protein McsA
MDNEISGTDDMKGYIILTDGRTAVKAAHSKTLMSKELRIQLIYENGDTIRKLTVWYWPKMKQPTPALVVTWLDPPCPLDTCHNWSSRNGSALYNGDLQEYAILNDVSQLNMFKPSKWIAALPEIVAPSDNTSALGSEARMDDDEDEGDELAFMVDNYETFILIKKQVKDGEFKEVRKKIMTCVFSNFEGMYRIVSDRSMSEAVYELYIIMKVNPLGKYNSKTVLDATEVNDNELFNYKLVKFPITLRQSDTKTITCLCEKMGSFWPPLGNVFTRHFSLMFFRDLLAVKTQHFLARKRILRAIDNFGFQYGTTHNLSAGLFCFANCVIDARSGHIMTHKEAGYKLMHEIFAESQLSPNFYPWICPVEDTVTRLRFFRTLIHLARKFTGVNYQAFMVTLASYFCAPKFEFIQREMFGVFIKVLTSSEGSTGKTEMIKMLNALFGMNTKAMCASATDAGLYEILGKIFSCIPICVDDLKTGGEKGNKLDETIKSLYDAMVRVVYKKMRNSRCQLMVTTNTVFCPNDQPVQSRLLLQTIRKISSFDSSLISMWRKMQSIASMLCVDILGFPINKIYVQDCIDYMTCILANKCIGTRSSQNWGLALYYRILIQRLIPCERDEWDNLFRYMAREICRITVEYSSDSGIIDKFSNCFRQMVIRNNGLDPDGVCFGLHTLRLLSDTEISDLDLDSSIEYYAFDLDVIVDVMARRLSMRKDDFNIKGIRLMLKGQLHSEGVREGFVKFYKKTLMLQHQRNSEREASEEDFKIMDDENKVEIYCFIVPRLILDLTANNSDDDLIDFRNITIGWNRNFYDEIVNDTWDGFDDLRKHPLYQIADEECLWQADNWSDPEYEKRQFMMIDNMVNLYRPDGTIAWPREDPNVDWCDDFYFGHSSITQDARINRMNFEKAQEEAANIRANALDSDDDENEDGLSEFENDSMIENDLPERDAEPWKEWVTMEYGTSKDPKKCPACKIIYNNVIPADRLLCGTCFRSEHKKFQDTLNLVDDELNDEMSKRQRLGNEVQLGSDKEDSEMDEDYIDGIGIEGESEQGEESDDQLDHDNQEMDNFVQDDDDSHSNSNEI